MSIKEFLNREKRKRILKEKEKQKRELLTALETFMKKPIQELFSKEIVSIRPEQTMEEVAKVMSKAHKGSLFVVKGAEPLGVIAESDFFKLSFESEELKKPVTEVMNPTILSVDPNSTLENAHNKMLENGFRKLAVTFENNLKGIVTQTDIVKAFDVFANKTLIEAESLGIIKDVMSTKVLTIEKGSNVQTAKNLMKAKKQNSIVVVEKEKPIGIITTKDILTQMLLNANRLQNTPVEMIMTGNLSTLEPGMKLFDANKLMLQPELNFRRWPVIVGEKMIGIVSQTDISRGIVNFVNEIKKDIEEDKIVDIEVKKEYLNRRNKE